MYLLCAKKLFMKFKNNGVILIFSLLVFTVSAQKSNPLIDSIKKIYITSTDIPIKTNASLNLGKLYNNFNTDSAMYYFRNALKIATENSLDKYKTRAYNNIGASYIMKGDLDSSEVYFDKAKALLPLIKDYNATVSYYGDRGILYYYNGDYKNAGIHFETALEIAINEKNLEDIIRYSNNSALVFSKTGNNSKAIDIYYKALKSAEEQKDSTHIGLITNNLANIFEDIGQNEEALALYEKALVIKKKYGGYIGVITGYFNIATIQIELATKKKDTTFISKAEKNYATALNISTEKKYGNGKFLGLEGLGKVALERKQYQKSSNYFEQVLSLASKEKNAPYEHMALLSLGQISIHLKQYKKAENYLFRAKNFVEESGSITQQKQLYNNLNLLYFYKKDYQNAYNYFLKQKKIEDQITTTELQNKISFYQVKYETEKKEKEIAIQKEQLLESELKIKKRNLYILLSISAIVILLIVSFGYYKRMQFKRKQLQKEIDLKDAISTIKTQNRLQEQRLRISRDLHDNIGSQLTFIISSIDNLKYVSKDIGEKLSTKLSEISLFTSDTIFQLRDTIWAMNKNEITFDDIHARVLTFVEKAKTAAPKTNFSVNNKVDRQFSFTSIAGINVFRVLQEAINNAIKYAEATEISILLTIKDEHFCIEICDNGKGFDIKTVTLGNGLSNMEKRMQEIGGTLRIDATANKGTCIELLLNK